MAGSERGCPSASQPAAVFSQGGCVTCFGSLHADIFWDFFLSLSLPSPFPARAFMLGSGGHDVKQFWTTSETGSQMNLCFSSNTIFKGFLSAQFLPINQFYLTVVSFHLKKIHFIFEKIAIVFFYLFGGQHSG